MTGGPSRTGRVAVAGQAQLIEAGGTPGSFRTGHSQEKDPW